MLRKLALIVAISPAIWFSAAYALGLGEIDVNSHLNQRFSAVIPLNSVSSEDAENLLVRLADTDDFNKAGIDRSDYLSSLTFQVVADAKNPRIVVSSKQLAREPFLSFLLDVRSSTGRVLREYTVLLDPPTYSQPAPAVVAAPAAKSTSDLTAAEESAQPKPQAVAPAPVPVPVPQVVAPKPVPAAPVAAPVVPAPAPAAAPVAEASSAVAAPSSYGPVKAQETFWSIATKLRPNPSVSMDQMLWALYSNNTQAFEGNSISGLRKGSVLKVPALSAITAASPAVAKQRLQDLQGRRAAPAKSKVAAPAPTDVEPIAPVAPAAPAPVSKAAPAAPVPKVATHSAAPAVIEKKTPEVVTPPAPPPAKPAPAVPATPALGTPPPPAAVAPAPAPAPAPAEPSAAEPVAAQTEPAASTPPPEPVEAPTEPAAEPEEPAKKASSGSDDLLIPVIAGVLALVLGLLGVRQWQKKQAEKDSEPPVLTPKATSNLQFWKKAAESAPSSPVSKPASVIPPPLPTAKPVEKKVEAVVEKPVVKPAPAKSAEAIWAENPGTATTEQPSYDATQTLDRHNDTASNVTAAADLDYDVTTKFENETLKMDMDANDPVSEAEFHLAYGLYDEAALLLESAAQKNPGRSDIRIKLAETYFRASKPHDFDDIAQSLKPQLDAADWQKIAIMGSQLLPDSPLYKGAFAEAELDGAVDLAFDEPADFSDASETKIFTPNATMPPSSRSNSAVLDFKLEDLETPDTKPAAKPSAPVSSGNTLEFNLSDFDLSKPGTAATVAPESADAPASKAAPAAPQDNALEFDLGSFDVEPAKSSTPEAQAADLGQDINLDDFDLGELSEDSHAISAGDEAGTKLDLARAYVDMGDNDMARSLLTEVLMQGSEEQKNEAQALIQRLA